MFQRKIIEFFHCALKGKKSSNHCSRTQTGLVQCKSYPKTGGGGAAAKSIIKQAIINSCLLDHHNPHYYDPPHWPHDLIFLCQLGKR